MEILKGFQFQIQRFAYDLKTILDLAGSGSGDSIVDNNGTIEKEATPSAETATKKNLATYTTVGATAAVVLNDAYEYDISSLSSSTVATTSVAITGGDNSAPVAAKNAAVLTLKNGSGNTYVITGKTGAAPVITFNHDGTLNAAVGESLNVTGALTVGANYSGAANLTRTILSTSSSSVTVPTSFAIPATTVFQIGSTAADTVTISEATNDTLATIIKGDGSVEGLDAGATVAYGSTAVLGKTVKTAAEIGAFTINGVPYTIGVNAAVATFTTSNTIGSGAASVTGLASGTTIDYTNANVTFTIGSSTIEETAGVAVKATSNGTGVSDVSDGGAAATIAGVGMSGRTGYTINKVAVTVNNDSTDGVDVATGGNGNTANPTITSIANLSKGASLLVQNSDKSAYVESVTVTTDNDLVVAGTGSGSSFVKVNGVTYYAGRSAANTTTGQLTLTTTVNGSLLTNGTVYLDGSSNTSIYVGNTAAAATGAAGRVQITTQKGDMSVTATAGAYTVHDLDNGDSFTVDAGTGAYTYQVLNGTIYQTTPAGVSTAVKGATLTSGNEGTYSLNLAFGAGVVNVTTGAAREDNVYSSPGDEIGEEMNISIAINNNSALTTFVKGNTNYISSSNIISTSSTDAIGEITYDSSNEVLTYTTAANKQKIDISGDANNTWIINGTSGADTIIGNAGFASTLNGGSGNDTITAAASNIAVGGDGDDSLVGAGANASLVGGAGKDTLVTSTATVSLTGGDGADVFVLNDGTARTGVIKDITFSMTDGSKYVTNHTTGKFD